MNFNRLIKIKPLFAFLLVFTTVCLQAQNPVVDSLQNELAEVQDDTTRILLANKLALALYKSNPDTALLVLEPSIILAKSHDFKTGLFELYLTKGLTFSKLVQRDSAILIYKEAEKIARDLNDQKRLSKILNRIGNTYNSINQKKTAIEYLNQSYELALQIKNLELQFRALNSLGNVHSYLTEHEKADGYFKRALKIEEQLGNTKSQGYVLMNLGNNAARGNDLEKALTYYQLAIDKMQEINDKGGENMIYKMMGYSCSVFGFYPRALEYYQKALSILEDLDDKELLAGDYKHLADVYISMKNYKQAIFYFEKASAILDETGTEYQRAYILWEKGKVFLLKKDYETALHYFNSSLQLKKRTNQNIDDANLFFDLGNCYEKLNQLDSAFIFIKSAIDISTKANDLLIKSQSLTTLGKIYQRQEKNNLAKSTLQEAIKTATTIGYLESKMEASKELYQIYKQEKDYKNAFIYLETYHTLGDSLFNKQNISEFARLEANYEFEKEKQDLAFKQKKEQLEFDVKLANQKFFQRIILITLAFTVLFLLITARLYRKNRQANSELQKLNNEINAQKEKLEELDEAKSRFFTNISHEFRTPLTIISGMSQQILSKPDIWLEKGAQMINQNSESLLNLVNQILDLRKLESRNMEVNLVQGNIIRYLRYITESYQSYAQSKGIQLHFLAARPSIQMDYDPDKLLRIISNLLSNAVKYTPDVGNIYFHIDQKKENEGDLLQIRVEDTGTGIPENQLTHIFDRFYQVDDSNTRKGEGTGIGLALTKELIKLLKGEIEVSSVVGKGTTFTLNLPITTNSIIQDVSPQLSENDEPKLAPPRVITESAIIASESATLSFDSGSSLPTLLIVEDNADVVQYLVSCLENDYQLQVTRNGQEGIGAAIEKIPDLIVSDVMMPVKDGFELCDTLKQDERTSHIPIILLTAKADLDSRISGLERGADAYLTKPFEAKELLIRLKKLLELRKKLQERFVQLSEEVPTLEENASPTLEDSFLQKIRILIEKDLSDSDFGMLHLSRSLGMSRSQVYRKVKALTGQPPTNFIRSFRLRKGKQLLISTDLTISEIAYDVGFSNVKYFSDAFLEEFGERPSATRK